MAEHDCKHEVDLALMGERIEQILKLQEEIKGVVMGNGKEGLKTQISRIRTKLAVQWALFLALFGLVAFVMRG